MVNLAVPVPKKGRNNYYNTVTVIKERLHPDEKQKVLEAN